MPDEAGPVPGARLQAVDAALERVVSLWALLGGALLLVLVAATALNAGAYLLGAVGLRVPVLAGYEDLVTLVVGAATLMLFPYCQLKRGHVAVDALIEHMPGRVQRRIDQVSLAATALLVAFLAGWMTVGLLEIRADGVIAPILGWPHWPFFVPALISLLLWLAVVLADLARAR